MLALAIELDSHFDSAEFMNATNKQINQAKKYALTRTLTRLKKDMKINSARYLNVSGKQINNEMETKRTVDTRTINFNKNAGTRVIDLRPKVVNGGVKASNKKTYKDSYIGTRGSYKPIGVYKRRGRKMPRSLYVYLGAAVEHEMDEAAAGQAFKIFQKHFNTKLNELMK